MGRKNTASLTYKQPRSSYLERKRNLKERIDSLARERFGYKELHSGQKEAIASILEGNDTLAVMPTGSGKSAIYQIAGLLTSGPTVVISPLISL